MRVIILGDKSRYQFLRQLLPEEQLYSEELVSKTLKLVSKASSLKEDRYISTKIPLDTEVIFPDEVASVDFHFTQKDLVLYFDEMPYQTEFKIEQLDKLRANENIKALQVVLYNSKKDKLDTDITSSLDAREEAKKRLLKNRLPFIEYPEAGIDTLLWRYEAILELKDKQLNNLKKLSQKLEYTFALDYELDFIEVESEMLSPLVLESLFKYGNRDTGKSVLKTAVDRAVIACVRDRSLQRMVAALYERYLKGYIVWNQEKDLEKIFAKMEQEFLKRVKISKDFKFPKGNDKYELELNRNKAQIMLLKNQITDFFKDDLALFLKAQIQQRIDILEEMIR